MSTTGPDDRSAAVTLLAALQEAAVAVGADDRVVAWNAAAEARLGMPALAAGRVITDLGLPPSTLAGAARLPLAGSPSYGAVAILAWAAPDEPSDVDVQLQKLRSLARLAADVSHENANYLSGFKAFFDMIRHDSAFVAEYGEGLIRSLEENARSAPELLGAYAELARDRPTNPLPQPLRPRVLDALRLTTFAMNVRRAVTIADDLPEVIADGSRLHQVLVALLVNALDALGGATARGSLSVTAAPVPGPGEPAGVRLTVEDDAPTIPEPDRAHLFDRLPPPGTTPRAGLDLAVARRLLELDGGSLAYEPVAGGNRLVALLRVSAPESGRAVAAPEVAAGSPAVVPVVDHATRGAGPATVLVCDDEVAIRSLITRVLERNRHVVIGAASAAEALAVLDAQPVDVVITDNHMTPMSGLDLYRAACTRHPSLARKFVIMSGDVDSEPLRAFASATGCPVLAKPFSFSELEVTIGELAAR